MRYQIISAALITVVSGHGVVTSIEGANGVSMPGLSVADGTPRDCSSNRCGSQADTSIIRDSEIESGEVGPLGRTQGNGNVDPAVMISNFLGQGAAPPENNGTGVGVEDNIPNNIGQRGERRRTVRRSSQQHKHIHRRQLGQVLGGLFGGGGGNDAEGVKSEQPEETSVAATAGEGAADGLPTADDNGVVTIKYRQINQDGAGPLSADIDPTSGGSDPAAFQTAEVTQDVPGAFAGLSLATNTDFDVKVQMPAGMTCEGSVGGADNVCVMRVRNDALAGPFGGSAAFTQSAAARKRAIEYRLKKRTEVNRKY